MNKNGTNYIFPLITQETDDGLRFCLENTASDCGIVLYDRASGRELKKIAFEPGDRIGNLYCKTVTGIRASEISYLYYSGSSKISDPRATGFAAGREYASPVNEPLKAVICDSCYDWGNDAHPRLKFEDSFYYLLHVRGFTKSPSSGVKAKGTYAGIIEKLDHLVSLGVTTVELQPAYEFIETECKPGIEPVYGYGSSKPLQVIPGKLNYWGYKPGYYYAPKANYSSSSDASKEFKDLVKELHKRGMELCMQFYFAPDFPESEVLEVLRYWVINYHVDGFHLMGMNIPMRLVSSDSLLAGTKLLNDHLENVDFDSLKESGFGRFVGSYTDDFRYPLRRLLKGDEGQISDTLSYLRLNPENYGRINFFSDYQGFTMMDMVSFDRKHNEENGEDGRDGSDYNFSWNCGEEGPTRKKKIKDLRLRQIKNAYSLLMLSAGTPLIFMGDEFGNSQNGNNNPYCIDSPVTWLDWKNLKKNSELTDYLKELVKLRRSHKIFSLGRELYMIDTENCGYPEMSYHSDTAYRVSCEYYSRSFGIMYCEDKGESLLYAAVNMGWDSKVLALPRPPKGFDWKMKFSTDPEAANSPLSQELEKTIPGRTVTFFETVKTPAGSKTGKAKK
ncbi:MAG: hypothetical protein J6X94_02590 [Lachnospiraceae bacterium]|nr:hypothetical protein [Lachnospiraceae bacterium]